MDTLNDLTPCLDEIVTKPSLDDETELDLFEHTPELEELFSDPKFRILFDDNPDLSILLDAYPEYTLAYITELHDEIQRYLNPNKGLKTPKRLFDISLMKTVLYEDAVDVEKERYVAISHVWGSQRKYVPKGVGVTRGVTWTVPLSDPDKMRRVKEAMSQYKKRYCWFDVLCLPQDKQEEVNEEIPFMGDYYARADMVLVLATIDPVISEEFTKWDDIMSKSMKEKRDLTEEERSWIKSHGNLDLLDISGEKWFTRLWTYQEAIMAKRLVLICSNGKHVDLFDVASKINEMIRLNISFMHLFKTSGISLTNISVGRDNCLNGFLDLVQVMENCSKRDCFKLQDKFYGAFGILGYKDFPVDYEIGMEDLNKAIVKHAYSKGDISWLSVGGDLGTGFIQPMDKPFQYAGSGWKEDEPGICGIRLEGEIMYINAWSFAKVVCHEVIKDGGQKTFRVSVYQTFKSWKLDIKDIVKNISGYRAMSNDEAEVAEALLEENSGNREAFRDMCKFGDDVANKHIRSSNVKMSATQCTKEVTIIKATTWKNKDIPLMIHGEANAGDQIMLVRMTDCEDRVLGIVVDKYFRRKGVCICEKMEMTEDEAISRYTPQEFPL
jgi:hypothetical protein